jgi:hypothetical protein
MTTEQMQIQTTKSAQWLAAGGILFVVLEKKFNNIFKSNIFLGASFSSNFFFVC